jgi:CRP-like cAMP-binding protein
LSPTKQRAAQQQTAFARQKSLFLGVASQDCLAILNAARERAYERGQTIHRGGDPMYQIVLLVSGSAKIIQCSENGSAVILRLCGPGDLIDPLGPPVRLRHFTTAESLVPTIALVWESDVFEMLMGRIPTARLNSRRILGAQLLEMEERFHELSTEPVAVRLSRQIVRLSDQVGQRSLNGNTELKLSREELAQLIGTTLFTVSRILSDWNRQGIVKTLREAVVVRDLPALIELYGIADNET